MGAIPYCPSLLLLGSLDLLASDLLFGWLARKKHSSNRMKIALLFVTRAGLRPLLTDYIPCTPDLEIPKEWDGNGLLRAHRLMTVL